MDISAKEISDREGGCTVKCVIVVDHTLPVGLLANTAAVLAMSIGSQVAAIIGEDGQDKDGFVHRGITRAVVPVLKGDGALIRNLRDKLLRMESEALFFVDFCDVAQRCVDYADYLDKLQRTPAAELAYLGIAICGPDKPVNSLTGSLGLLR